MTRRPSAARRPARFATTALLCGGLVVGMVGMAFAAVPLYRIFCQVTGYGGTTQRSAHSPAQAIDRTMTVRFDANVGGGLDWEFRPEVASVDVQVGAPKQISFFAKNNSTHTISASATFNVTPDIAGAYFDKIACFCFDKQTLKPGESAELPVLFYVDPTIAGDQTLDRVDTITLSYTFFAADPPKGGAVAVVPISGAPRL